MCWNTKEIVSLPLPQESFLDTNREMTIVTSIPNRRNYSSELRRLWFPYLNTVYHLAFQYEPTLDKIPAHQSFLIIINNLFFSPSPLILLHL